jgi:hypothetical protein
MAGVFPPSSINIRRIMANTTDNRTGVTHLLVGRNSLKQLAKNVKKYVSALLDVQPKLPSFDLQTHPSGRHEYNIAGIGIPLVDRELYIRFRTEEWPLRNHYALSFELFRYQNKGGSKYKRIGVFPIQDMGYVYDELVNGYVTMYLPWTLMRIFYELFDPHSATQPTSYRFHRAAYDATVVAENWLRACYGTPKKVLKYGHKEGYYMRDGLLFSGSFGIRIVDAQSGAVSPMEKFQVALIGIKKTSATDVKVVTCLNFSLKSFKGQITTSY